MEWKSVEGQWHQLKFTASRLAGQFDLFTAQGLFLCKYGWPDKAQLLLFWVQASGILIRITGISLCWSWNSFHWIWSTIKSYDTGMIHVKLFRVWYILLSSWFFVPKTCSWYNVCNTYSLKCLVNMFAKFMFGFASLLILILLMGF